MIFLNSMHPEVNPMADRYLMTGVQLGMIKGFALSLKYRELNSTEIQNVINEISKITDGAIRNQLIGFSNESIDDDVKKMKKLFNKGI